MKAQNFSNPYIAQAHAVFLTVVSAPSVYDLIPVQWPTHVPSHLTATCACFLSVLRLSTPVNPLDF